jgi:hypothetical protein
MTQTNSFSRHVRVRALPRQSKIRILLDHAEGSGAPKGAYSSGPCLRSTAARLATADKCTQSAHSCLRSALAFRRSTSALAEATERFNSAQAALHAIGRVRALPTPPIALKRCTSRAGRHAGGDDARTARERGYKPRPQEPHSLHQSAVTGDAPRMSEVIGYVTETGTNVKPFVAAPVTCFRGRDEWEQTASQLCAK